MSSVRNLDYLRGLSSADFPGFGQKLYEALSDINQNHSNLAQQANGNSSGDPQPPPAINGIKVTGQNGHFDVAITDNNAIYRGIQYYAEYSSSPNFTSPRVVPMGGSRNHSVFLGNGTYYWRGYSSYPSSAPSAAAYHGSASAPQAVSGGGSIGGPAFQPAQGSGTGAAGQGLQGPGTTPFRSTTGAPPTR